MTKRKTLRPVAFPCGDGQHSTFILGVRVRENGGIELTGLIRMPYHNRPKEGGGIAVPYKALNVNGKEKAQGRHFERVRVGVRHAFLSGKAYIRPVRTGI